jgi:hypothetical protein
MTPKEYAQAAAHHDLKIDLLRDAWLRSFTLEQRIRYETARQRARR